MKRLNLLGLGTLALLGIAAPASAAEIIGALTINGVVIYDNRAVSPATGADAIIDFIPLGTGEGLAGVNVGGASGYFFPLNGQIGSILDLTNVLALAGTPPATGPIYTPGVAGNPALGLGFLQDFSGALPNLVYNLTGVLSQTPDAGAGDCAVSAVAGCVANGILKLGTTSTGVTVAFSVLGFFVNGADSGFYEGQFTATFVEQDTVQELFDLIEAGFDVTCPQNTQFSGGCGFTANFEHIPQGEVPEPATMLTFGAGAALLAALRRRAAKRVQ